MLWSKAYESQGALSPQWLAAPILAGKSHGGDIHRGVLRQQHPQVGGESVLRVNAVQPVGDAAQYGIETGWRDALHIDPGKTQDRRQLRPVGQIAVPHTGMVGTVVAQHVNGNHPTLQVFILCHTKTTGNALLCGRVGKVPVEPCQASERGQFQHLPRRREVCSAVFHRMLPDELLFRALQLPLQCRQVLGEISLVNSQRRIKEPERPVSQRELVDDARAQRNLNPLDGSEQQLAQLHVERVERGNLLKRGPSSERVIRLLEDAQIGSEAEVTDIVEELLGFGSVVHSKATQLQGGELVGDAKGGFVVVHKAVNKKGPSWYAGLREARAGSDGAKVRQLSQTAKHFREKVTY